MCAGRRERRRSSFKERTEDAGCQAVLLATSFLDRRLETRDFLPFRWSILDRDLHIEWTTASSGRCRRDGGGGSGGCCRWSSHCAL